ncbi:MAG: nucleotidyltransferase family protein, partial [Acidobacteria bacterium]|nr:nucleotidyltransferase family protein [Acidobacteriota bacterium]
MNVTVKLVGSFSFVSLGLPSPSGSGSVPASERSKTGLPLGDFEAAVQFLMDRQFVRSLDDDMSPHKNLWHGEVGGLDVTVEIHRRLFAEEPPRWHWQTTRSSLSGVRFLTLEQELFFLIHHVAHQHTFLKLFWLRDIALFLKRYGSQLEWGEVWSLAEQFHREKSVMAVLLLMVRYGPEGCCEDWMAWDIGRKGRWVLSRISPKFLWH